MRRTQLGGLDVVLAGGDDGHGRGDGPCLVLLHGFGAPGEDLVALSAYLRAPAGTRLVFPAAPLELGLPFSDARAWWMIDVGRLERDLGAGRGAAWRREVPAGLAPARERLLALLDELGPPARLVLGGFSQGAMLACDVALRTGLPLSGLVLLSGTVIAEDEWAPRFAGRRGLRVFQSHGTQDPLLPHETAIRLRALWEEGGADVTFVAFAGGHEIPPLVLGELATFLGSLG
jgi:phospholipase/carboxylesterase